MQNAHTEQSDVFVGEVPEENLQQNSLPAFSFLESSVPPEPTCEFPEAEQNVHTQRLLDHVSLHVSNNVIRQIPADLDLKPAEIERTVISLGPPENFLANHLKTYARKQDRVGSRSRDVVLTINYREGERPMSELLRLEGGRGSPVIVESVAAGSKAARAGVAPGYALVSMDGRSEFTQLPAWHIHRLLEAPIALGFDPAPAVIPQPIGPCTEIRLKRTEDYIGVSPKMDVCGPKDRGLLAEEVVFKPGAAPLFLKTSTSFSSSSSPCGTSEAPDVAAQREEGKPGHIYELRHKDAQVVVGRAVHGARAVVGSTLEVESVSRPEVPEFSPSWRHFSPVSYCSLDFVAECVESHDDAPRQTAQTRKGVALQRTIGRPALHQMATPQLPDAPMTPPKRHSSQMAQSAAQSPRNLASMASPAASTSGRDGENTCELDDDDADNWMNINSSKSPFKWLAPVLEPVMRAFSPSRSPSPAISPNSFSFSAPTATFMKATSPSESPLAVSPQAPCAQRRTDAITPILKDIRGAHSPRGSRGKAISTAVKKPVQIHDMPPAPLPSQSVPGASSTHPAQFPRGPRSLSPQNRLVLGDRFGDGRDYNDSPRRVSCAQPVNKPSFSVSWTKEMLQQDSSGSEAGDDSILDFV